MEKGRYSCLMKKLFIKVNLNKEMLKEKAKFTMRI